MIRKCEKIIFSESGEELRLVYSIIETSEETEGKSYIGYGIRIDKYIGERLTESAEIPNITSKTLEIDRLFMVLSNNTVTPMCLKEVVEEYLADVFCGG